MRRAWTAAPVLLACVATAQTGLVWSWAANHVGQLGENSTTGRLSPVRAVGLTNVVAIAGGCSHTIAARSDGAAWSWGQGASGERGNGDTNGRLIPTAIPGLNGRRTA